MPRKAKKTTRKRVARKVTARRTAKRKAPKRTTTAKKSTRRHHKAVKRKKVTTRKTVKAAAVKRKVPKSAKKVNVGSLKQAYTKSQVMSYLADCTELTKKDISNVFDALNQLMEHHLKGRSGPGEFTLPGFMKCVIKRKPATKARPGVNPFTGESIMIKAKPARNVVKVRPLKKLKEMCK